jgi:DNA (cytosine-5)-methyltransferase 1
MALPYMEYLNDLLQPRQIRQESVLDLFSGCGGLALGFEAVGFKSFGIDADADCCLSYGGNLGTCRQEFLTTDSDLPSADIVIGGPPCQPFSVGGLQEGHADPRNGFPSFLSAIARIRPRLFLLENVRGLTYRNRAYFEQVVQSFEALGYIVERRLLNAVHFGVPQNRERVIVVGHKGGFSLPSGTGPKVAARSVIGDTAFEAPPNSKFLTENMDRYIAKYERASACVRPRDLDLDRPARTLTCRNLAGATGDMQRVRLPDGRRRRLLIREAARLQTFPDWFTLAGTESSQFNQIGNAVPPLFAYYLALAVARYLDGQTPETLGTQARLAFG